MGVAYDDVFECRRGFEFVGVGFDVEFELVGRHGCVAEHNLFDLLGSVLEWHNHFYIY